MSSTIERGLKYVMNTYSRYPIVLERGEGTYVYDEDGKKYLDFMAGIAVNALGHGNARLAAAIAKQASELIHVSNYYWTKPMITLAEKLVTHGAFDKAFFSNSGAEANEGALKLARKYARKKGYDRHEIICMENSFHGRTFGAITATGQKKYQKGLDPLLPGIIHAPYNDFDAVKSAVNEKTCAILIEPIQGESGVHPTSKEFLVNVRALCSERDMLLIYDEVQCGVGRTGTFFAYEHYGVAPDALTLAKGMAGGVPIGVLLATDKAAEGFSPGDHAATFGGNPLATAAAVAVFDELFDHGVLDNVKKQGAHLKESLLKLKDENECVKEVRGVGLMMAIELNFPVRDVINKCIGLGMLLASAGDNTIRFVPPLNVTGAEIDECVKILGLALK